MVKDRIFLARRRELRLSQAQIAELLGVHAMTVSKWERGVQTPRRAQVQAIADLTGWIPVEWFYLDEEAPDADSR